MKIPAVVRIAITLVIVFLAFSSAASAQQSQPPCNRTSVPNCENEGQQIWLELNSPFYNPPNLPSEPAKHSNRILLQPNDSKDLRYGTIKFYANEDFTCQVFLQTDNSMVVIGTDRNYHGATLIERMVFSKDERGPVFYRNMLMNTNGVVSNTKKGYRVFHDRCRKPAERDLPGDVLQKFQHYLDK